MRIVVKKKSLRLLLVWTQRLFFSAAILMLGSYGFVWADRWIFERRENRQLDILVQDQRVAQRLRPASLKSWPAVGPRGLIGRMEIPRLGLSVVLFEGTANTTLRRAVGHIAGTALPGQPGNVGIAGHRDGFFRPLRDIHPNDIIRIATPGDTYLYRVVSTQIVSPEDVAVLNSDGTEILTLVTCYPFYFVGSAPDRFIVRAARITG